MAIFGNLAEMPLTDVLGLVGRGSGQVIIRDTSSRQGYELNFHSKGLISLLVDCVAIQDVFAVSHAMGTLMRLDSGDFILDRNLKDDAILPFHFFIPVEQLILSSVAAVSELDKLRPHLPSERTVFIASLPCDKWMEDELMHFYELCGSLLSRGACASDIADQTGLPVDRVQLNLYKLRSGGLISPLRAAATAPVDATASPGIRPSLFKSRPAADAELRRRTPCIRFESAEPASSDGVGEPVENAIPRLAPLMARVVAPIARTPAVSSPVTSPASVAVAATPTVVVPTPPPLQEISADLRNVNIERPKRGLIDRLMGRIGLILGRA